MEFPGFPADAQVYLAELAENNAKAWFEANRHRHQSALVTPLSALVKDLTPAMLAIDPQFEVRPAVGRTLSRPNRDIRFSRDKSPYRTSAWLVFRRPGKYWPTAPAFFFEIDAEGSRYGMGFYSAPPAIMAAMRQAMDEDPEAFAGLIAPFQGVLDLEGETYKRTRPCVHDPELCSWYQRKNVYIVRNRFAAEGLGAGDLPDEMERAFTAAGALYSFLTGLVGQSMRP